MLSIIIPAFNEEKYLTATIASLRDQHYSDYEIIVVDDCSQDGTLALAKKLGVKVVSLSRRSGAAHARNMGAQIARGDYFVFLDADVLLTPCCLEAIATQYVALGTCRALPSNHYFIHRVLMWCKNLFICPVGVSNGIILCSKDVFAGGFPNLQQGEDGVFIRRLKKKYGFRILSSPVIVSTRRFEQVGYLRMGLHWIFITSKKRQQKYSVVR